MENPHRGFESDIAQFMTNFDDKFELMEFNTNNYFKNGFTLFLKTKFSPYLTQRNFGFRSAKATYMSHDTVVATGFLDDLGYVLRLIR